MNQQEDYNFLWILHVLFVLKNRQGKKSKVECLDMKDNPRVFLFFCLKVFLFFFFDFSCCASIFIDF
jgi:hypothetical protein